MPPTPQPLEIGKGKTVMLFGIPGAGKTRYIVGRCPKCLIIRPPQDNTDSIAPGSDCTELIAEDWNDMNEYFSWLQQGAHEKYKWVWLDSISLMQDELLDDVMDDVLMRRPDRGLVKGGLTVPEFGPDQGDYKVNFDRIAKWVRQMTGIAKAGAFNFGITAHPFEWFDPGLDEYVWAPWIQGKGMIPKICGYMNIVCYLQEQRDKEGKVGSRVLLTDQKGYMGKDQLHCFPELKSGRHGIVEPTGEKLVTAIKGSKVKPSSDGAKVKKAAPKKAKRKVAKRRR